MKLKKPKKVPIKKLKNLLWKLTSKYVRTIESNCYTCGKFLPYEDRQAGHYWSVGGHQSTRYDLMNIHTQCCACNLYKSGNLAEYAPHLIKDYGIDAFMALQVQAKTARKFTDIDYNVMIDNIKNLLSKLNET